MKVFRVILRKEFIDQHIRQVIGSIKCDGANSSCALLLSEFVLIVHFNRSSVSILV